VHCNVLTKIVRRRANSKLVRAMDERPRPCLDVPNGKVALRDLEANADRRPRGELDFGKISQLNRGLAR
jgi:hypothetical protein